MPVFYVCMLVCDQDLVLLLVLYSFLKHFLLSIISKRKTVLFCHILHTVVNIFFETELTVLVNQTVEPFCDLFSDWTEVGDRGGQHGRHESSGAATICWATDEWYPWWGRQKQVTTCRHWCREFNLLLIYFPLKIDCYNVEKNILC